MSTIHYLTLFGFAHAERPAIGSLLYGNAQRHDPMGDGSSFGQSRFDTKGKGRATHADDAFRVVRASLTVSVAPVFANDLRGGVEEMLDSMLMRYVFPRSPLAGCNGTGR